MAQSVNQQADLDREIRDLRRQIEKLSALLALKKLESAHPRLERAGREFDRIMEHARTETARIRALEEEYLGPLMANRTVRTTAEILFIGVIGYGLLRLFGWLSESD